jgi:Flp pilus assembly protein TadG
MRHHPVPFVLMCRSERGSISVLFALMSLVLMAVIGAAVDYAKWHDAYTHVETAMDSALLAAGRQYQTDPTSPELAIAAAQSYFDQTMATSGDVQSPHAAFTVLQNPLGISGNVTGRVTTPFLGLVRVATLPLHLNGQAEFGIGGAGGSASGSGSSQLEVSLMLDVTESMCNAGAGPCTTSVKMDAMKFAAKDLVSIITSANATHAAAKVALVPFSGRVRVAPEGTAQADVLMKRLTNLDSTWTGWRKECTGWSGGTASTSGSESWGTGWTCDGYVTSHAVNWKLLPCVTDRTGPAEFTDAAPGPNTWLNGSDGNRTPLSWDSDDAAITSETGTTPADPSYNNNYSVDGLCWDIELPNYVLPLSSDATVIKARIDTLSAYGPTGGALGTAWAWYMLSPNWSSFWTGASTPGPYSDLVPATAGGAPKLRKIAVLMTDGDYNTYRADKAANDDYGVNFVSNNAKSICANMKAQGIEVFTVGFDLDSLPAAEKARATDTLQTCGSDISHFYNSLDPAQLKTAFRDIALKLSTLYLSK